MKILIVKLSAIGDIVHAIPSIKYIRTIFPKALIHWIVDRRYAELLSFIKDIDELIIVDLKKWKREFKYGNRFIKILKEVRKLNVRLRGAKYDYVFDIQGLIKSGIISWFTGCKNRYGFYFKNCREPLSAFLLKNHVKTKKEDIHITDQCLRVISSAFNENPPDGKMRVEFSIDKVFETSVKNLFSKYRVGEKNFKIMIMCGGGWETKILELYKIAQIGDWLIEKWDAHVMLLWGDERELQYCNDVKKLMKYNPIILDKLSIGHLIALINSCDLVMGGDTGIVHIAGAIETPTLSWYGPSYAKRSGPRGENHIHIQSSAECSPCYRRKCNDTICMRNISSEEILSKLNPLMEKLSREKNLKYV